MPRRHCGSKAGSGRGNRTRREGGRAHAALGHSGKVSVERFSSRHPAESPHAASATHRQRPTSSDRAAGAVAAAATQSGGNVDRKCCHDRCWRAVIRQHGQPDPNGLVERPSPRNGNPFSMWRKACSRARRRESFLHPGARESSPAKPSHSKAAVPSNSGVGRPIRRSNGHAPEHSRRDSAWLNTV